MTHKLRWLALSGLMALLAASAAACGSDENNNQQDPPKRCATVECGENFQCDESDGICKCQGLICQEDDACVVSAGQAASCVSSLCVGSVCKGGTACDPVDGACKCGGEICAEGEACNGTECVSSALCAGVACGADEECDPVDGLCKCGGLDGVTCSFGQLCVDGTCQTDACAGVNCGPGTFCNPGDGLCHCGNLDGPACTIGQTCVDEGGTPVCEGIDVCAGNTCPVGTVCDPTTLEGVCRCGGLGVTRPECADNQTCDMDRGICMGGDQCGNVVCLDGTSCNEENGSCSCGGIDCGAGQMCVAINGAAACTEACSVFGPNSCGTGRACYFDANQAERGGFCAPVGEIDRARACTSPTECKAGLHCGRVGVDDLCYSYCEVGTVGACAVGEGCMPLAPASNIGICR